jgi:hypothetical protein
MTHAKHTTIVETKSDEKFLYIATVVGPDPNAAPYYHRLPKITLTCRAAEYNLDIEDPLALDITMREHLYHMSNLEPYEKNGLHPLLTLPSVELATEFMAMRIEDVRVDRKAPQEVSGNRMLAGAVKNKAATKALVEVHEGLLRAYDKRVIEPLQFYRDQIREKLATPEDPIEALLRSYKRDRARVAKGR